MSRTAPSPEPGLLDTYAMTDPAQEHRWRTRLGRVRASLNQTLNQTLNQALDLA